jgi:hypothetical protein
MFDQRQLADPGIALAQIEADLLGQPHQLLARPVQEFAIGGEHHGLRLHRGVDDHSARILGRHRPAPHRNRQALLQ